MRFTADEWNRAMADIRRNRPLPGINTRVTDTGVGYLTSASSISSDRHPWYIRMNWQKDPAKSQVSNEPAWWAFIDAGLVNGRDAIIEGVDDSGDTIQAALTDEEPLALSMVWRNPIDGDTVTADENGTLSQSAGEGYPKFFETLNVRKVSKAGPADAPQDYNPDDVCELRACDIFLTATHIAANNSVDVTNPATDFQAVVISTTFENTLAMNNPFPFKLQSTGKFVSTVDNATLLDRLNGTAVQSQIDKIKIATVYAVSPPNTPTTAEPDENWGMYPAYDQFYNLGYATKNEAGQGPQDPLTLQTGLAFGIADQIFASLLDPINDQFNQISAYLGAADYSGKFWSV